MDKFEYLEATIKNRVLPYKTALEPGMVEDTWRVLYKGKVLVGVIDWRDGKFSSYQLVDLAYRFYEPHLADKEQVTAWLSQTLDAFEAQQSDKK